MSSLLSHYHKKLRKKLEVLNGEFLYRGQKYFKWGLQSGAVGRINEKTIQLRTLIEYHDALLEPSRLRGWNRDSSGRRLGDLELLAKLQHHGAATCLLDFTTRFDIALWFACQEVSDQEVKKADRKNSRDGKVFVVTINQNPQLGLARVRSNELEETIGYFLRSNLRSMRKVDEKDKQMQKKDGEMQQLEEEEEEIKFWYWEPETLMGRMLSQESRFLFGPQDIPEAAYFSIDIEEDHKEDLLAELVRQQGLRPETVFSDIHGFADINARNKPWKPKNTEEYMQAGINKLDNLRFAGAIEDFDEVIDAEPNRALAWFYRGLAKGRMRMHEAAIEDFDKATELNSRILSAWFNLGLANELLGRYEEAIIKYSKAIKSKPNYATAIAKRGEVKMKLGHYKRARSDMVRAFGIFRKQRNLRWQKRIMKNIEKLDKLLKEEDEIPDFE